VSFDFQIGHQCPHLTIEEEVSLGSDRRELRTRQPVASRQIRITANDDVTIPQQGLFASGSLTGAQSGPFRIVKNENTITISNRTQSIQNFELPIGPRISTDQVVEVLNTAFLGGDISIFAQNDSGVLVITDFLDEDLRSRVRVDGDARAALGFSFQYRARGKEVYPGWEFAEQESLHVNPGLSSVRKIQTRFPKFTKVVPTNPVFKVSYTTYQQYCRRCQSFGIENDYRITASGAPLTIADENLLNQDVLKVLSTIKGSNPFNPEYGTVLLTRIGSKALGDGVASINEDVVNALRVYQRLQQAAGRYQEITSRQTLASLASINTFPSELDPTVFEVQIVATNAASVPVVISTVFAAPGTAALAGTNGMSLGLEGFGVDPRTGTLPGVAPT
jgi:phage baseplate assembly protein W